jgi:hypothetical protein
LSSVQIDIITRKPEKSNGITDGIFPSVIYTDGNNSVSKSIGIYRQNKSVGDTIGIYRWYTDGVADGVYSSSGNMQRCGDVRRFYRWKLPRDSNWDSRTVMWHCHRQNHRRNNRQSTSISDSVGKNHYMHPSADTLFLCFSFFFFAIPPLPSQTAAPLPNCNQTPIPNSPLYILNTSTQVSYILYVVTISVSCRFYIFFVSKSIFFSFNI